MNKLYIYSAVGIAQTSSSASSVTHSIGFSEAVSEDEARGKAVAKFQESSRSPVISVTVMEITDAELAEYLSKKGVKYGYT